MPGPAPIKAEPAPGINYPPPGRPLGRMTSELSAQPEEQALPRAKNTWLLSPSASQAKPRWADRLLGPRTVEGHSGNSPRRGLRPQADQRSFLPQRCLAARPTTQLVLSLFQYLLL